jgi:general stress protein 26
MNTLFQMRQDCMESSASIMLITKYAAIASQPMARQFCNLRLTKWITTTKKSKPTAKFRYE